MKVTKRQLKRIIREEMAALHEQAMPGWVPDIAKRAGEALVDRFAPADPRVKYREKAEPSSRAEFKSEEEADREAMDAMKYTRKIRRLEQHIENLRSGYPSLTPEQQKWVDNKIKKLEKDIKWNEKHLKHAKYRRDPDRPANLHPDHIKDFPVDPQSAFDPIDMRMPADFLPPEGGDLSHDQRLGMAGGPARVDEGKVTSRSLRRLVEQMVEQLRPSKYGPLDTMSDSYETVFGTDEDVALQQAREADDEGWGWGSLEEEEEADVGAGMTSGEAPMSVDPYPPEEGAGAGMTSGDAAMSVDPYPPEPVRKKPLKIYSAGDPYGMPLATFNEGKVTARSIRQMVLKELKNYETH